jgi:hypothetical protein
MLAGGGAYRAKITKTKLISSKEGGDQLIQLRTQVIDWMSWQWREGGNVSAYRGVCVTKKSQINQGIITGRHLKTKIKI